MLADEGKWGGGRTATTKKQSKRGIPMASKRNNKARQNDKNITEEQNDESTNLWKRIRKITISDL